MTRFTFNLATRKDDNELRELLAATPMDGNPSIAFARQPSYFVAAAVDGTTVQVGVVRDGDSGRVIGMGSRSISLKHVNGERVAVGYLSGLRLRKEYRGQAGLLARAYRFLRRLHEDHAAPFYLTTIAADNDATASLLTSGRAGLPVYYPCGNFHTLSISAARLVKNSTSHQHEVTIRPAKTTDRDAILLFLNAHGPTRQFFPAYESHDLFSGGGLLTSLNSEDIMLAYKNDEIVGTLGCWNQCGFKQIIIHSYHGWLRPMRPLYNVWAALWRRPTLPAAGSVLPTSLAAIPVVRDDDRDVFRRLLETTLRRLAHQGKPMLLLGLHEADPFLPIVRQYSGREYLTKLYVAYWPDEVPDVGQLMQRIPYLELGSL